MCRPWKFFSLLTYRHGGGGPRMVGGGAPRGWWWEGGDGESVVREAVVREGWIGVFLTGDTNGSGWGRNCRWKCRDCLRSGVKLFWGVNSPHRRAHYDNQACDRIPKPGMECRKEMSPIEVGLCHMTRRRTVTGTRHDPGWHNDTIRRNTTQ